MESEATPRFKSELEATIDHTEKALEDLLRLRQELGELALNQRRTRLAAVSALLSEAARLARFLRSSSEGEVLSDEAACIIIPDFRREAFPDSSEEVAIIFEGNNVFWLGDRHVRIEERFVDTLNMLLSQQHFVRAFDLANWRPHGNLQVGSRRINNDLIELRELLGKEVVQRQSTKSNRFAYRIAPNVVFYDSHSGEEDEADKVSLPAETPPALAEAETSGQKQQEEPAATLQSTRPLPPSDGPPRKVQNILRLAAERRARSMPAIVWSTVDDIAEIAGLPSHIVSTFIARNRRMLGSADFPKSRGHGASETFSPGFAKWAIESLLAAKARYEARQESNQEQ